MALLQHKALADYAKQLEAFQSFLEKFETSKTSSDAAAEAIDGLHLDGDHTSDEYDFMDDVADGDDTNARRRPKRKYMDMLQEVADRERQNILIDLDDLQEVRATTTHKALWLTLSTVRRLSAGRSEFETSRVGYQQHKTLC